MALNKAHLPAVYTTAESLKGIRWTAPDGLTATQLNPNYQAEETPVWAGDGYDESIPKQRLHALQERAALSKAHGALLDAIRAGSRPNGKREQNELDATEQRLDQLNEIIARHEIRQAEQLTVPAVGSFNPDGSIGPAIAREIGRGPAAGPKFAQMFGSRHGDTAGFRSVGEFLGGLHAGMWDNRYQALLTGGDGNGTSLQIPEQFAAELFDLSLEGEIVRPRARIEPMTSDTKKIAGFSVGTGGNPFGISGGWTPEAGEIGESSPQSRAVALNAHGLKVLVQISNEAAADGTAVDAQLTEALTRGLGWLLDSSFLTGTGAGQPLGIHNAACTITVTKETAQGAATILYENLTKMLARLHPASFNNSVWVANPTTIPQLLELTVMSGTGGSVVPVLRETDGAFYLLTRPIVFTEKVPALGTKGDIGLYDFKQYAVGLRAELRIEKSGHVGFTRDTTYYRGVIRADGGPMWDAAYTPDNGDTTSPFVVLQTRS